MKDSSASCAHAHACVCVCVCVWHQLIQKKTQHTHKTRTVFQANNKNCFHHYFF